MILATRFTRKRRWGGRLRRRGVWAFVIRLRWRRRFRGRRAAFEFGRFRIPAGGRVAVALPNGETAFARYHGNYRGAEVVYADGNLSAESARGFCAAAGWRLPHMGEAAGLASARGADLNLTLRADVDAAGVDAARVCL